MQSKNKPAMTAAERRHVEKLAEFDCVVCGGSPVEIHEPEQGLWFAAMPLCHACHRHPVYGWHGQRQNWKARKMGELDAIAATVRRLMAGAAHGDLERALNTIARPWQPMKLAPKDGTAILALLDGSDIPHAVRWLRADDPRGSGTEGWHVTWDGAKVSEHYGLRYWMACPDDPDDDEPDPEPHEDPQTIFGDPRA